MRCSFDCAQITFHSGAVVTIGDGGVYYNIYVSVPGIDNNHVVGMCGNFNGNPNDDAPGYIIQDASQLFPGMVVTAANDLWRWKPTTTVTASTLPPYAAECAYVPPPVIVPVISAGNAVDITDLLRSIKAGTTQAPLSGFNFNDSVVLASAPTFNKTAATITCTAAVANTPLGRACATLPGINIQTYIDNCIIDLELSLGDTRFTIDAVNALQAACIAVAGSNPSTWIMLPDGSYGPPPNITNNVCPNSCSGQGTCQMGVCICNSPYTLQDCSHNSAQPASVTSLFPSSCDAEDPRGCPTYIQVSGSNFLNSTSATCKIGSAVSALMFVSATQVLCTLPANTNLPVNLATAAVSVSNDGVSYSVQSVSFTWFDSICFNCDATGACTTNPTACAITGTCYRAGVVNPSNPCLTCDASQSANSWSSYLANTAQCSPNFDLTQYTAAISTAVSAGYVVTTVHAGNQYLASLGAYTVTYSLGSGSNTQYYTVNPTTGAILTVIAVDPASVNYETYSELVVVVATDTSGNSGSVSVFVSITGTDRAPVFNQTSFTFSVKESLPVGTAVGNVFASDPDAALGTSVPAAWSVFLYSWLIQEAGFIGVFNINNQTGAITTAQPISFNVKQSYSLQARAFDNGGASNSVSVTINIVQVNVAPTNILLSNANIASGSAAQTVVGALSDVDPNVGDSATYQVVTPNVPFAVSGSNLIVTAVLNYFTGPQSYSVSIRATDKGGLTLTLPFTINVLKMNVAPSNAQLASASSHVTIAGTTITVPQNFSVASTFATASAFDPDSTQVLSCVVVSGSSYVLISNNQASFVAPLSFETTPTFTFMIACADNSVPALISPFVTYTVNVQYSLEVPQQITLTSMVSPVPEDTAADTVFGTVSAVDPDWDATTLTFSTDASDHFKIVAGTTTCSAYGTHGGKQCQAQIAVRGGLNSHTLPVDTATVTVTNNYGLQATAALSIDVSFALVPPTGAYLTTSNVTEGALNGAVVGTVVLEDQNVPIRPYTVYLTNTAGGRFALKQTTRRDAATTNYQVVVAQASLISAAATPSLSITLRVLYGAYDVSFDVAISVLPRPVTVAFSSAVLTKDSPVGFEIGLVSLVGLSDPAQTAAFQLSGTDSSYLTLVSTNVANTAGVTLRQSVASFSAATFDFTITATFTNTLNPSAAHATIVQPISLTVLAQHVAPAFAAAPSTLTIRENTAAGTQIVQASATDLQGTGLAGSPLVYTIRTVTSGASGLFVIDSSTAVVSNAFVPSKKGVSVGSYNVEVTANDGILSTTLTLTIEIVDNCAAIGNDVPCSGNGDCAVTSAAYTCTCNPGYSGDNCETFMPTVPTTPPVILTHAPKSAASSAGLTAGATAGVVVGILVAVLIALIVVLVVVRRSKAQKGESMTDVDAEGQAAVFNNGFMKEETYDMPIQAAVDAGFEPGVANPMYAWYQPQMSRQECEDYLNSQAEGAFVIRDSSFTPGWHMLAVKASSSILHERIKLHADGTYELLPSTNAHQPNFRAIPDLVEHYAVCKREGINFSLALDNPIYDNHLLHAAPQVVKQIDMSDDADAPVVPMRENEREQVAALAGEEQELYTNTEEAKVLTRC